MDPERAVRLVFEEGWNHEDFTSVQDAMRNSFTFHVGGVTREMNLTGLREVVSRWRSSFPDLRFEVHSVVASGDRAAAHATLHGTQHGEWSGMPPTGRSIEAEHMFFFRFEEGQMMEIWELLDGSALRRQLTED